MTQARRFDGLAGGSLERGPGARRARAQRQPGVGGQPPPGAAEPSPPVVDRRSVTRAVGRGACGESRTDASQSSGAPPTLGERSPSGAVTRGAPSGGSASLRRRLDPAFEATGRPAVLRTSCAARSADLGRSGPARDRVGSALRSARSVDRRPGAVPGRPSASVTSSTAPGPALLDLRLGAAGSSSVALASCLAACVRVAPSAPGAPP